uniref:Uncharacterized protein n=1 Tax=Zonotrichia albicollis TaxID=44394 RepID=A0A8D2QJ33_ZONAL
MLPVAYLRQGAGLWAERTRDGSASNSAPSLVIDLYCTPSSSRSHLFLPSTAGDFSSGTSISAYVRPGEVPSAEQPLGLRKSWGVAVYYLLCE